MSIDELKAIAKYIDIHGPEPVRIKINYPNGIGYLVKDIRSFELMNGGLVLNVDVDYVPNK